MRIFIAALLAAVLLVGALVASAHANTAREAYLATYQTADLGRDPGQEGTTGVGWRSPIEPGAVVQPDSARQVAFLADQTGLGSTTQPAGKLWWAGLAVYTVDAATPYRTVCLTYAQNGQFKGWSDYMAVNRVLVRTGVPIPPDPSGDLPWKDGGQDQGLTIYSKAANALWEFYKFRKAPAGLKDPETGKTCNFLSDVGQRMLMVGAHGVGYRRDGSKYVLTYPNALRTPGYWRQNPPNEYRNVARAASKLPAVFGAVTGAEWNSRVDEQNGFGHIMSGALPWGRRGSWVWPAAATDAWSAWAWPDVPAIQEGARLRLAPDANCQRGDGSLFWIRARRICYNFKRYGWIGTDQTGYGWSFLSLKGGDQREPDGVGESSPNRYMAVFKDVYASKLQVLQPRAGAKDWTPGSW